MDRRDWLTRILAFFAALLFPWRGEGKQAPITSNDETMPSTDDSYKLSFGDNGPVCMLGQFIDSRPTQCMVAHRGDMYVFHGWQHSIARLIAPAAVMRAFYDQFGDANRQHRHPVDLFVERSDGKQGYRITAPIISSIGISVAAEGIVVAEGVQLLSYENGNLAGAWEKNTCGRPGMTEEDVKGYVKCLVALPEEERNNQLRIVRQLDRAFYNAVTTELEGMRAMVRTRR